MFYSFEERAREKERIFNESQCIDKPGKIEKEQFNLKQITHLKLFVDCVQNGLLLHKKALNECSACMILLILLLLFNKTLCFVPGIKVFQLALYCFSVSSVLFINEQCVFFIHETCTQDSARIHVNGKIYIYFILCISLLTGASARDVKLRRVLLQHTNHLV